MIAQRRIAFLAVRFGGYDWRLLCCALVLVRWSNLASAGDKSRPSMLRWQPLSVTSQLALSLPRMLSEIEADLATAGPAKTQRLRQRAELIRRLLTPRSPPP